MTTFGKRAVLLVAIAATIGCDRLTKQIAETTLAGRGGQSFLGDTVRLQYAENAGGFLSLGENLPEPARIGVFTVGTGFGLLLVVGLALRSAWTPWPLVGLSLFVSGGASNWLDRVLRGSVIDFLNVGVGPLRTGIFNVADMAIMLGAAIIAVAWIREKKSAGGEPEAAPTTIPADAADSSRETTVCPRCGESVALAKVKGCVQCLTCHFKFDCNGW